MIICTPNHICRVFNASTDYMYALANTFKQFVLLKKDKNLSSGTDCALSKHKYTINQAGTVFSLE